MSRTRFIPAALPSLDALYTLDANDLSRADEAYRQLAALRDVPASLVCLDDALFSRIPNAAAMRRKLRHPLSLRAVARAGTTLDAASRTQKFAALTARAAQEWKVLVTHRAALESSMFSDDGAAFIAALEHAASDLCGARVRVRREAAFILPDAEGVGWHCIDHAEVTPRLHELHDFIATARSHAPFVTAIVALVMVSGLHPFMDGNGRLGRVLFHAILHRGMRLAADGTDDGAADDGSTSPACFVPLRAFYFLSDFGFEIRLRRTFLHSDWPPMVRYFCNVIACHCAAHRVASA
jgi:hypothetical protein